MSSDIQYEIFFLIGSIWCTPRTLHWDLSCSIFTKDDVFLFIKQANNCANDNAQAYFTKSMPDLANTLEKETTVALLWLDNNEMIVNSDKFNAVFLIKD